MNLALSRLVSWPVSVHILHKCVSISPPCFASYFSDAFVETFSLDSLQLVLFCVERRASALLCSSASRSFVPSCPSVVLIRHTHNRCAVTAPMPPRKTISKYHLSPIEYDPQV